MCEFEIDCGRMTGWAGKIEEYSVELKRQKGRVDVISRQLAFKGEYRSVETALSGIAENINRQQTQMKQCGGMLENIVKAYQNTESGIVSQAAPLAKVHTAAGALWDLVKDVLGQFGVGGGFASLLLKLADGSGTDAKDVLQIAKWLNSTIGKTAEILSKSPDDRDALSFWLGISDKTAYEKIGIKPTDSVGTKWGKYFSDQADGYVFSSAKNAGENVKVATKWIGLGLSFALSAIDNKKEQGGVMTARAWGETVTETLLNLGGGALLSGFATVALGASAPAIAIGAISVVASWGIDSVYRMVSGSEEGIIEDFSDFICDKVVQAKDAVAGWMNKLFSGGNSQPAYA